MTPTQRTAAAFWIFVTYLIVVFGSIAYVAQEQGK